MAQIEVIVTTPEGVKLKQQVDELTAPSVEGEFGVLPGHLPLLAGLKTGIVRLLSGGEVSQFAVGPGFVQVTEDRAAIITERFKQKADVDAVVCRKELREAEEAVEAMGSTFKREAVLAEVLKARWSAVCLELYGDPPPPTWIMDLESRLVDYEDFLHHVTSGEATSDAAKPGHGGGAEA